MKSERSIHHKASMKNDNTLKSPIACHPIVRRFHCPKSFVYLLLIALIKAVAIVESSIIKLLLSVSWSNDISLLPFVKSLFALANCHGAIVDRSLAVCCHTDINPLRASNKTTTIGRCNSGGSGSGSGSNSSSSSSNSNSSGSKTIVKKVIQLKQCSVSLELFGLLMLLTSAVALPPVIRIGKLTAILFYYQIYGWGNVGRCHFHFTPTPDLLHSCQIHYSGI